MLSAFDIAVLQERYGAVAHATGNDVYTLKDVNAEGTFYECIWDTGGTDVIRYAGTRDTRIDLTAATLDYYPDGRRRHSPSSTTSRAATRSPTASSSRMPPAATATTS